MNKKVVIGGILIFVVLLMPGLIPLAIIFGSPLLVIYALYKAITGIMTHNAKLKSQYGNKPPQDPENRWTSGQ